MGKRTRGMVAAVIAAGCPVTLSCPVVPCRGAAQSWTALSWCGAYRDRFACSIINARHSGIVQQRGRANFSHVSSRSTARGRTTAARGEKRCTTSAFQPPTGHPRGHVCAGHGRCSHEAGGCKVSLDLPHDCGADATPIYTGSRIMLPLSQLHY